MDCRPFLPGDRVWYQYYVDVRPLPGKVEIVLGSGLLHVLLDNGVLIEVSPIFVKHFNTLKQW